MHRRQVACSQPQYAGLQELGAIADRLSGFREWDNLIEVLPGGGECALRNAGNSPIRKLTVCKFSFSSSDRSSNISKDELREN
jgi:hypothetical protein